MLRLLIRLEIVIDEGRGQHAIDPVQRQDGIAAGLGPTSSTVTT
jgi:hypothetical protein